MEDKENKVLDRLFTVGLFIKAINGIIEILGGLVLLLVSQDFIIKLVAKLTQEELLEDPTDLIARFLNGLAQNFSLALKFFLALYLLIYGSIKFVMVIGIFKKKPWVYPSAIFFTLVFMVYQIYRLSRTYELWLIGLIIFDTIVIYLIWREYKKLKTRF